MLPLLACLFCWAGFAQNVSIIDVNGWLETAMITWTSTAETDSFSVYYSGEGITDQRIDDQLIRNYNSYYRADIPGLTPGSYTLKICPIVNDVEQEGITSDQVEVTAYDRSGFAFANYRIPGAYKADGTLKDNAVILYITENTKNTISMDVTGANENPCVGLETILEGFKKGKDSRPLAIRMIGQITDLEYMDKGDIIIENSNNASSYITLEGIGDDATADGWGIRIKNASNVEIRNIGTMNCNSNEGDNIGLQQGNDYIWVHNCDFFYGDAGSDSDQAKGDGALDCKKSTYVTLSYNHFWDSGKSNLLGLSEGTTEGYYISYHHNWYDHSDSRHPRVRYYSAHVYNNYYDGNSKYGVGSTMGSSVFVEGNYFRHCKYPILTSMQGSDVFDESTQSNDYSDMPTFSKEDGGTIKAYNNYMEDERRFIPYADPNTTSPDPTVDFDAYVAQSRDEQVPSSVVSSRGSNTYNNFDTNASIMYAYTAESPEEAKATVMQYAGRMFGGDFTWTFDNETDDTSYDVNSALKAKLKSYTTSLISVQGDGAVTQGGGGGTGGGTGEITADIVHNFTLQGMTSDYFSISGNLSDSKGTVLYGGLTLTQCLKIESSTSITFSTSKEGLLTLVFNDGFSGEIKVNGSSYAASNGVLELTLEAGDHSISKDETCNLYLMSLDFASAINNARDLEVKLYPNPAKDQIQVQCKASITSIKLYCMNGQLIQSDFSGSNQIKLTPLSKGIYVIKINTTQGSFSDRIVVH